MDDYQTIFITIFIFIFIFLILYIIMLNKICNSKTSLEYFTFISENFQQNDPTIVILGTTHGNEPAGYYSIKNIINKLSTSDIKLKKGKLILIPVINYCAFQMGLRFIPFIGDINRKYPLSETQKATNPIIIQVTDLIKNADFILDFHEGWGYNRINNKSMGSTLTPGNTNLSLEMAQKILKILNDTINDNFKKFRIFTENKKLLENTDLYQPQKVIKGTLSYYSNILQKNYILIETSGQDNISPLTERVKQNIIIIESVLNYYNMI